MRIRQFTAALAMGVAALALSACAETINTTVSRYQAMPAPQGQTFFVVPDGGMAHNGGLEFQRYAGLVAQQLQSRGYAPAANAQSANMVVQFGYGVDRGQVRYVEDAGLRPGLWLWGFVGRRRRSIRASAGASARLCAGAGTIPSGTAAEASTAMSNIIARSTSTSAPPARMRRCSTAARRHGPETNRLDVVIPSLVDAMFTGLPGPQRRDDQDHHPDRPQPRHG